MRQCILLYVLLLLFYPWVMPDTRMYESISSIFVISHRPMTERRAAQDREKKSKKHTD